MTARRVFLVLPLACLAVGNALAADKPETPRQLPGGRVVSVVEARAVLAGGKAMFIDTRSALSYGKGHIPGALSVAYREKSDYHVDFDASVDQFDLGRLGGDLGRPLVFYSDGPTGWKSYKAAVLALRAGYRQVLYLREGWAGWEAAHLPGPA